MPSYGWRFWLALVSLPIFFLTILLSVVFSPQWEWWMAGGLVFTGAGTLFLVAVAPRRIHFRDTIVVERYLLGPRVHHYSDIADVGLTAIKMRRGRIVTAHMENADELFDLLEQLRASGRVADAQVEGRLAEREVLSLTAATYGGVAGAIIGGLLVIWAPPWLDVDSRLILVGSYTLGWGIAYLTLRMRRNG